MRRRSPTPASPFGTRCWRCGCRSSRCTSRTSSRASRSGGGRCSRISRWAWWRASARTVTGWASRAWSRFSRPAVVADRRRARQEALLAAIAAEALDALLVTALPNIRYLTGFSGSAALVVVARAGAVLVTDFRYEEQAAAEAGAVARVVVERTSVWDRLFKELGALGRLETVGYESHALTVKEAERLTAAGKAWRWKPAGEPVERLRARKDPDEVAAIRAAAQIAGAALREALAAVRPGMTGRDADALARDVIEARGFGDAFGHSLGHGLGLEVHETPRLARPNLDPLPADAVVTIEPGVYLTGQGGVRIEDDVHLAADGPVLLSDGDSALVELT